MAFYNFRTRGHSRGVLVLETSHATRSSVWVELMSWRARMVRGDITTVDVVDMAAGTIVHCTRPSDIDAQLRLLEKGERPHEGQNK